MSSNRKEKQKKEKEVRAHCSWIQKPWGEANPWDPPFLTDHRKA
jgi:hypothetical protein